MTWYHENRWIGNFLITFLLVLLVGLWFLFHAKRSFGDAMTEFNVAATERSRLEHLTPFPDEENVKKTQIELENYGVRLNGVKGELGAQVLPTAPMAPNEFQSRLRQTILNTTEKARANRVKLPENFCLGFDEFVTSLPGTSEAPLLGQELRQIELLAGILIDAKVDGLAVLKRVNLPPGSLVPTTSAKAKAAKSVAQRSTVDLTFAASLSAMRKVLNQIANSERQFFIVRTLYVRDDQLKGPSREETAGGAITATTSPGVLKFIVGNEHIEISVRIELVRFAF